MHIVGARPNFMKVAPVMRALASRGFSQVLVHTGQHYSLNMSDVFFQQLEIPEPDVNLEVGSGSHAVQTARIMVEFEKVVADTRPDLVFVYGDVNSTVAAALVCSKLGIPVAHVEAGLRSFDRRMPEEINRLLTDQIAELLFTPSLDGNENLAREGVPVEKIFFVGNVMIDSLIRFLPAVGMNREQADLRGGGSGRIGLVTLHRPSNVDDPGALKSILMTLDEISSEVKLIFPAHPRTREKIREFGIQVKSPNFCITEPLGYLDFLALMPKATMVITDSGGIQEETTYLGVPCLTVRENTERPITVNLGTNILVGQDMGKLRSEAGKILKGEKKEGRVPPLWDGKASERLAEIIKEESLRH